LYIDNFKLSGFSGVSTSSPKETPQIFPNAPTPTFAILYINLTVTAKAAFGNSKNASNAAQNRDRRKFLPLTLHPPPQSFMIIVQTAGEAD
jgi:hypothetical protein